MRQAYVWEKNRDVSEWLQSQLADDKWPQSVLCENIRCLKRDYVMQQNRTYVALHSASVIVIVSSLSIYDCSVCKRFVVFFCL